MAQQVERGCPRCFTPMPIAVLQMDPVHCGTCSLDFNAAVFEPPVKASFQPPDAAAVAAAQCARHPRNAAVAACDQCGAFMCSLCHVDHSGQQLCTKCFEKQGAQEGNAGNYRDYRALAVALAVLGALMWVAGVLFGPGAIAAAIASRRQQQKWGNEVSLFTLWGVFIFGVVETLAGGVFIFGMLSK
jgi:hypothetical protein